ncbi:hypothetical protein BS50DRAFT_581417 [Corynespora cassiicola Philippines]|uniref:WSC domain-containing protein n=1 Tax=Corynespora cassiicola Philippines TaxID=1448308 RepID=A0A2T2PAE2_CORCC|nr:hypothetical protein BS50DRAFT_581417 [Corynespora cassiicola Philippines]
MARSARSAFAGLAATLALLLLARPAAAVDAAYCSSQNTADGDVHFDTYQSNGWCRGACPGYAYGIIQEKNCWCSNYAPAQQEDTDECDDPCPGYPDDKCGNKDDGLYIYIALDSQPSGTKGAPSQPAPTSKVSDSAESSSPASTKAPPSSEAVTFASILHSPSPSSSTFLVHSPQSLGPSLSGLSLSHISVIPSSAPPSPSPSPPNVPSPDPETVIKTVTASASAQESTPTPLPSAQPTTLSTSASSSREAESSMTSIQVVTESGVQITKTIIITPSSSPAQAEEQGGGGGGGGGGGSKNNTGAIVGGVVGGVVGLAAIIGAIFFFLWRRRRQQQDIDDDAQSGVQRNVSTLSKAGLLRGEKSPQYPPPIATSLNSKRASRTLDTESISPVSGSDRRNSRPYVFDQRLNPSAIMTFDNGSRGSFASLEDSRDYGRTLNVRNPDPDS